MNKKFKTIGIIGGAGPMASALLYRKIIERCQQEYGASDDADFPEIVLVSYPFSLMVDVKDSASNTSTIIAELQTCMDKLSAAGCQVISIACNTLHTYINDVDLHAMQLCSLIKATQAEVQAKNLKNILFLGTTTSRENNIFATDAATITYPSPELQEQVGNVIDTVLTGKVNKQEAELLMSVINTMQLQSGCDGVVLGCTELSVLYDVFPHIFQNLSITILDPLVIISHQLINESINKA